ncbi:MAG: stage 0 sporulation family protein [Firmicutes bacterium]|nr:stage 0 sporulation family protein [Bacillota bacterium]
MVKVVGVRFKHAGKIYYFDPADIDLGLNDPVIVETVRGIEYGDIVVGPKKVDEDDVVQPLKQVIRRATQADIEKMQVNREKEESAFDIALKKIEEHGLPMKLVDVEYTFDDSKILFYFTADGRVDFRDLVKDLAGIFRTRIELRQIGVRDQAKMLGGLGPCGRSLCCATFLGDFEPVSIKMAKEQNLSLNPSKISGICGRLMCCLRFETDMYKRQAEESSNTDACTNCEGCDCKSAQADADSNPADAPVKSDAESGYAKESKSVHDKPKKSKSAEAAGPKGTSEQTTSNKEQSKRPRKRRSRRPRQRRKK